MLALSKFAIAVVAVGIGVTITAESRSSEIAGDREKSTSSTTAPPAAARRERSELSDAAKDAIKASHAAKSAKERDSAARQLVQVFTELRDDQSISNGERQNLYHQIRTRLLAIEQGVRSAINRETASKAKPVQPEQIGIKDRQQVLGQQMGPAAPPNGAQPPVNNQPGAGQQANNDYGQELLDLIQKVIRPSTWDINGGPSSGYYFEPLNALVISAPEDVQEEIGGVLGGLRN